MNKYAELQVAKIYRIAALWSRIRFWLSSNIPELDMMHNKAA